MILYKNIFASVFVMLCSWFLVSQVTGVAQNAPVTTASTVANALPGQQVTVPVTVTGFNDIGSITLYLNYDYSKLHFLQCTLNPILVNNFYAGDIDLGNGTHQIVFDWYTSTSASLTDGTWLLNFVFTYLSGSCALQWYTNSCLYTNGNGDILNDIPTSYYYHNGMVCGIQSAPGQITGSTIVCQGQSSVSYSIPPMQNVTGYSWTSPNGSSIVGGINTNSILVNFSNNANSGNVTVSGVNDCGIGPASSLPITVNLLPTANAGNDTTINYGTSTTLHATSGGAGSISYHWSPENLLVNPNLQNPQTVPMTTTTIFQLVVTNTGTSCTSSDNVTVAISGGPLTINPVAVPAAICRFSSSQLYANAGGGTGSYNYSWSCVPPGNPPWTSNLANPVVSPDSSRQYLLTVTDGFASSTGSTNLAVNQLPTATISGGDSLCDDGSMAQIRIDLTGIPPWSFVYSNGLTTTTINNQQNSPYLFQTSDPGVYTVLSVHNENCYGTSSGNAPVVVSPIPSAPVITQSGTSLISNASTGNQWYRDFIIIPGATTQIFTPSESGKYYDIVTLNGCPSDTSNNLDLTITITKQIMSSGFQIFPNPAKDYIFLKTSAPVEKDMRLTFFSDDGIPIREVQVMSEIEENEYLIDIRSLSPGFYFLMIYNGDKGVIQKLVIL